MAEDEKWINPLWIFLGFFVMIGFALVGMSLIERFLSTSSDSLKLTLWIDSFFLGGVAIGRLSPGKTIKEPIIAAIIAIIVIFISKGQPLVSSYTIIALIHVYIASLLGAYLGEKWQGTI